MAIRAPDGANKSIILREKDIYREEVADMVSNKESTSSAKPVVGNEQRPCVLALEQDPSQFYPICMYLYIHNHIQQQQFQKYNKTYAIVLEPENSPNQDHHQIHSPTL